MVMEAPCELEFALLGLPVQDFDRDPPSISFLGFFMFLFIFYPIEYQQYYVWYGSKGG